MNQSRGLTDDAGGQQPQGFRRIDPTPDIIAEGVTVAQSLRYGEAQSARGGRRRTARQMAVVEIASAIVGATMTRILDNDGDVVWELDQLQGLKHPDNKPENQGPATFSTKTLKVPGPIGWTAGGLDEIYAHAEVTFQYNGRSLGNVQVSITETEDAFGAGLIVKGNIMDDATSYTRPPNTERFAAVKLRFHYRFTNPIRADMIAITDLVLYGDGNFSEQFRWTQK